MRKRRIRFVEKFQLRLVLRMCAYFFIFQVTLWNLMFCWRLWQHGTGNLLADYRAFAVAEFPVLLFVLILAPLVIWDTIKFCHRVAGPIYRIRRRMLEIAEGGPLETVRFRKGDPMDHLEEAFNRMIQTLAAREAALQAAEKETPESGDCRKLPFTETTALDSGCQPAGEPA